MSKFKGLLVVAILNLFAMGCSTYSKKQCESFDWDSRGYMSALKGERQELGVAYYYKECSDKYGVQPQEKEFSVGYGRGLKVFCTPDFAVEFASKGGEYAGICTAEQEKGFMKPYIKGINVYYKNKVDELESKVSRLESENSSLESDKRSLEGEVSDLESKLNSCSN